MAPPCTHTGASVASTSSAEYNPHGSTPLKSLLVSPRCVLRGLLRPSVIRPREPGTNCVSSSTVAPGGISYLSIGLTIGRVLPGVAGVECACLDYTLNPECTDAIQRLSRIGS